MAESVSWSCRDLREALFTGPNFLEDTCTKYMMPVSDATESEGGVKRPRQQYQGSQVEMA
jgi:hypothetical protein